MRLSQATVKFLGKTQLVFGREKSPFPLLLIAEGLLVGRVPDDGLTLTVKDYMSAPEWSTQPVPAIFSRLRGIAEAVELIVQRDRVEIDTKGAHYNIAAGNAVELPSKVEDCFWAEDLSESYKVEDPDSLTLALQDCLAGAAKDGMKRLDVVIMDGGEMLSTDGHRITVRYSGVGGLARIPRATADLWLKMLKTFDRSKGGWWFSRSEDRIALTFRHFGQQVRVASSQAYTEEGCMTGPKLRRALKANGATEAGGAVDYDARAVRDFCKLFDVLAFYSNGAIVGWVKGEEENNGNDGLVPHGEHPLFVDLIKPMLPKVSNKGYAPPLRLSFGAPCSVDSKHDVQRSTATIGDSVLMAYLTRVPQLAEDAYTLPAAVKAA